MKKEKEILTREDISLFNAICVKEREAERLRRLRDASLSSVVVLSIVLLFVSVLAAIQLASSGSGFLEHPMGFLTVVIGCFLLYRITRSVLINSRMKLLRGELEALKSQAKNWNPEKDFPNEGESE